jgi:hypothetical protein
VRRDIAPLARRLPRQEGSHLGTVEAETEREAIDKAAVQFNVTPARRNKLAVTQTRVEDRKRGD